MSNRVEEVGAVEIKKDKAIKGFVRFQELQIENMKELLQCVVGGPQINLNKMFNFDDLEKGAQRYQ